MKILYLHQYFRGPGEAGGTRSYEFARRWVQQGNEVHIVTTWQGGDKRFDGWASETIDGINMHRMCVPYDNSMSYPERIRAFLKFAIGAAPKAIEIGGDVIFATSTPLTIAIPAIWASKRLSIPMVFEVRDLWPDIPIAMGALRNPLLVALSRKLEDVAYRNAEAIVALSPGAAEQIKAKIRDPRKPVISVSNSCDLNLFQHGRKEVFLETRDFLRGKKIVAYTGTLGIANGVDYLVKIAAAVERLDPDIAFVIAGEGKQKDAVVRLAEQLSVKDRSVYFLPQMPKSSVADLLAASSVATSFFVDMKVLWDNSANKFFDAIASGKPIIINHEGWLADLIRSRNIGLVVPPNDAEAAGAMLRDFVNDESALEEAGRSALQLAQEEFDRDKLAREVLETLTDVVRKTQNH